MKPMGTSFIASAMSLSTLASLNPLIWHNNFFVEYATWDVEHAECQTDITQHAFGHSTCAQYSCHAPTTHTLSTVWNPFSFRRLTTEAFTPQVSSSSTRWCWRP